MKFMYACDVHGDERKYQMIFKRLIEKNIKLLVLGGDLLPKQCNRDVEQPKFIKNYLNKFFEELKAKQIICLCILGNDDISTTDEILNQVCEKWDNVYNIDKSICTVDDCNFIGLSNVLDHPFGCKDRVLIEKDYEFQQQLSPVIFLSTKEGKQPILNWFDYAKGNLNKMEKTLENLPINTNAKKDIYVFHMPPKHLQLDVTGTYLEVGSQSIYDFIKKNQPYMTLHGHIHESPEITGKWYSKLGNTICIQPGQTELYNEQFVYVIVDTNDNTYERIEDYAF